MAVCIKFNNIFSCKTLHAFMIMQTYETTLDLAVFASTHFFKVILFSMTVLGVFDIKRIRADLHWGINSFCAQDMTV